jgi:hypothetical protein
MSCIEDQIIRARERGDVTIDEIMRAVVESQDMTLAWHRMEEGSYGVLNHQYLVIGELIAAAIADARREGAIEAQQRMFPCCGGNDEAPAEHTMDCEHTASRLAELDAARREGAEQMREAIAHQAEINALYGVHGTTVSTIRAMPLPTGPRQAVLLTDEQLTAASGRTTPLTFVAEKTYRAIETAVLAANGLRNGNG